MTDWAVYILRCADETLYTGITTDADRRMKEHNGIHDGGARYTRARRPVTLVYLETLKSRSEAAKREFEIKRLSREDKEELISAAPLTSPGS